MPRRSYQRRLSGRLLNEHVVGAWGAATCGGRFTQVPLPDPAPGALLRGAPPSAVAALA